MIKINIELSFIAKCDHKSGYNRPRPGHTVNPQFHNNHEIVFYSTGCNGITTIDGIDYKFKTGDVAFISKKTIHSEKHFSLGNLYFLQFNYTDASVTPPKNGIYNDIWDVKLMFDVILKESINQPYKHEEMISHKIKEILLILERSANSDIKKSVKNLSFVKNYIDENHTQNINMESLAGMMGYSGVYFRKLFTEAYGISPKNYIINIRCTNAQKLLQTTDLSCTEIAYQCGFSTSSQMTQMLKRKFGKSPLEIRKNCK